MQQKKNNNIYQYFNTLPIQRVSVDWKYKIGFNLFFSSLFFVANLIPGLTWIYERFMQFATWHSFDCV